MQRYVSVAGRRLGMTVFARGLPEYEVRPDGNVMITLARVFTELSRPDLPERPGRAGWPAAIRDAIPEPWSREGELAVLLHGPEELDSLAAIEAEAERLFAAPAGLMRRALLRLPADAPGAQLEGEGLVMSTVKPAESGRGVVLRCYNSTHQVVRGAWQVAWPVRRARLCRLDERPAGPLRVAPGGIIAFTAGPRAVVSIVAS
jgi:alpha-mannosidase